MKNAVYLLNYVSWPLSEDTSSIWPQMRPWSSYISVMLLERGIRDISRVLVLARNSVYSACSVDDAIPHVYKMEGHRSFRENPLILSS